MPQQWDQLDFSGGVSITKHLAQLDEGEVLAISGLRFSTGDTKQLYRDLGTSVYGDYEHTEDGSAVTGYDFNYLSFESGEKYLLVMGPAQGNKGYWSFLTNSAQLSKPGIWTLREYDQFSFSTRMAVIHQGDQYFISSKGTKSFTVSAVDDWRLMGMKTQKDAGVYDDGDGDDWVRKVGTSGFTTRTYEYKYPIKMGLIADVADITNISDWGTDLDVYAPPVSGTSSPKNFDGYVYYVTEYDKDYDVESVPYYCQYVQFLEGNDSANSSSYLWGFHAIHHTNSVGTVHDPPWRPEFDFAGYTKLNDRTTHLRLYRFFVGNATEGTLSNEPTYHKFAKIIASGFRVENVASTSAFNRKVEGDSYVEGGLVSEIDLSADDLSVIDPIYTSEDPTAVQWRYNSVGGEVTGFYRQMPPRPFTTGVSWNDVLITNINPNPFHTEPAEQNVLQYSIRGEPEYFPRNQVIPITSDEADTIMAVEQIGDTVLVLTPSGVHRLNYIPALTDSKNEVVEQISSHGLANDRAFTTVTMPQGRVLVWLSYNTVRLTSGDGDVNACLDFSAEKVPAVYGAPNRWKLYNNQNQQRLELAMNGAMYHLYYGREHLKPGGFKLTGPHALYKEAPTRDDNGEYPDRDDLSFANIVNVAGEGLGLDEAHTWVGTTNGVLVLNQGLSTENLYVHMGRITNRRSPLDRITVHRLALQHSAVAKVSAGQDQKKIRAVVQGKSFNQDPSRKHFVDFVGQFADEVDRCSVRGYASGNWVTVELFYEGDDDQAWGPLWAEMELMPDGG